MLEMNEKMKKRRQYQREEMVTEEENDVGNTERKWQAGEERRYHALMALS